MRSKSIRALAASLVFLAPISPAAADEFDGAALYDKCVKSTVFIVVPHKDGNRQGSGSLIDAEKKLVITNSRVVGEADSVLCQFPIRNKDGTVMQEKKKYLDRMAAGQAIKGTVLYKDLKRDLALVQLDKVPPDTPALPMSRTRPRVGEKVIAIGNPEREKVTFSTTEGVLRAVDVRDALSREPIDLPRVKTVTMTNPVFPGDSGGPVIDKRGFLVAVVESIRSDDRTQKVNGAIDVTEVRAFLTEKKIKLTELAGDKDK